MKKYIDTDALKEKLKKITAHFISGSRDKRFSYDEVLIMLRQYREYALSTIDGMPATDVEPVRKWHIIDDPDKREQFPEYGARVLVSFINRSNVEIAVFCHVSGGGAFFLYSCSDVHDDSYMAHGMFVYAWQELPVPPKMEAANDYN